MNEQPIKKHHLEKTAFVYLRQSSPTQVKRNLESARRQRGMVDRVKELGWPATQIQLLGGDTGHSGTTLDGRGDYQVMLDAILSDTAGLIAARELSRLARDNQDWNHLIRLCRHQDVLLMDEHRLYQANDPQDRVVLGIAGAFNEFEVSMIIDRMLESQRQKAARGELYEGRFSPGYVCRVAPLCERHPDERAQRAVMRVFDHFDRCVSVLQLHLIASSMASSASGVASLAGKSESRSMRRRPRPCFGRCLRRATSTRIRRIASAAAAKKWPRESQCRARSSSTSRM